MLNTTIFSAVRTLAMALDDYFNSNPFVFKSSESNTSFEPAFPSIYEFCIPPEDRNSMGYPVNSPAIAIIVEDVTESEPGEMTAKIGFHIAVCNPSTSDAETVEGTNNKGFEFLETSGYSQAGTFIDLYVQCLRLGEECLTALGSIDDKVRLSDLTLIAPDVTLPDFPYCTCVLTANMKYRKSFRAVSQNIAQYL